ncbi:MAG: alpha/beta hydrolase [Cellulophaga sp.]|nr:alpha/beta hydrolase [Cellulophaga sp.]
MKKIIKWSKRILLSLVSLLFLLILGLWVAFYFYKKEAVNDLPKNSLILNTVKGPIEYTLNGNSNTYMLMVHGSPGSVHIDESKPFVDNGFSVLTVSRPGYYKTPLASGKSPKEQAALFKSLLDTLHINSVYINGISGGGPSSIQFALDYPERTDGLILRAAVSEKIEENNEKGLVNSFFATEFGTWLGIQIALTQVDDELKQVMKEYMKKGMFPRELSNDGYVNDVNQFNTLQDFPLEKIKVPTILLHGDKDDNVPFSFAQNATKRIPNATLFQMKGKDHFAFAGAYRDTINREIINFINNK